MFLRINPNSDVPIFRQVVEQIKFSIASGATAGGSQIPSVRGLSQQLGISPMTVQKAYRDLEQEGVLKTLRGQGTFVVRDAKVPVQEGAHKLLQPSLESFFSRARQMGLSPKETKKIVEDYMNKFFEGEGGARGN